MFDTDKNHYFSIIYLSIRKYLCAKLVITLLSSPHEQYFV